MTLLVNALISKKLRIVVKALILSGGSGKRLKPMTDYVPKPMIPINNIPIIEWQIRYLQKFGIDEFVICAGYKSNQIINYLGKKYLSAKIEYSIEKTPLGTGGAIKKASDLINDKSFFVINGDVITNLDPMPLRSKVNAIAVIPLRTSFGLVNIKKDLVTRFEEKPQIDGYWMNAGIYHLSKETIRFLPKKGNIENTAFPIFATKRCLSAVKYTNAFWHSIDSHKDIEECTNDMQSINYEHFIFTR